MKKLNYLKNELGCKTNEDLINFMLKNPKHPRTIELKEILQFLKLNEGKNEWK
ncbi:hypothetical protein [Veillonella sp. VA142]|uniref:hypothetical protein n=1 Tax=Veillonella sp. VA142 TaxID=741834 RepID=UPI0013E01C11|nr:hypothetical protein [Veillonella sp. VA142]